MRATLIFTVVFYCGQGLFAQDPNAVIYRAFVDGKMDRWVVAMKDIENKWLKTGDYQVRYDLVVAQYGYIAYLIGKKEKKEARQYVEEAEAHLEGLLRYNPRWARAHALLGAVYGFKVGLDPYKAVVYGKRAFDENDAAFRLAPEDPQVWMEKANIELYKPTVFGDNSLEAMKMYQEAASRYEQDPAGLENNWLYLNTLIGLAAAADKAGEVATADATYRKILEIEPGFKWIRDKVYPSFRERRALMQ